MRFEIEQADLTYQCSFALPLFDAWARPDLYATILSGLASFSVAVADLRVQSTGPNPVDQLLSCVVPSLNGVVHFRLDRIEVASGSPQNVSALSELADAAVGIARKGSPALAVVSNGILLTAHGTLTDGSAADLIGSYLAPLPPSTPLLYPQGVTLGMDGPAPTGSATVTLERSLILGGGLFLRIVRVGSGDIPPGIAVTEGMRFAEEISRQLNCELFWQEG